MKSICGANCDECGLYQNNKCQGCVETKGCPFGKKCWIAKYIEVGDMSSFEQFKKEIITEFNNLNIDGMPEIKELNPLHGEYVNLEYPLPNGTKVKLLNDNEAYLGNQVECLFNDDTTKRCFGLLANPAFLLVSEYGEGGSNPEIVIYKKR